MDRHELQQLCAQYGIRGGRALGQNFLCSDDVLERTVAAAQLQTSDTVLEVGPGFGVLTQRLAPRVRRVVAVELDRRLAEIARDRLRPHPNVEVVTGDILRVAPSELTLPEPFKVVANLPYQITAHFLRQLYGDARFGSRPMLSVLMLQQEVATRLAAGPGDHSLLSLSVQLFADVRVEFKVPKDLFWPVPKVDSAVVGIRRRDPNPTLHRLTAELGEPIAQAQRQLFSVMRQGFSSPRKQLQNTLRAAHEKPRILAAFTAAGVAAKARGQDLTLEQWIALAKNL